MKKNSKKLNPVNVSEIDSVLNENGGIKEYRLVVTFETIDGKPPHARGASTKVNVTPLKNKNGFQAEYRFPESVMKRGMENVLRFKTELMFQINKDENTK